MAIVKTENLQLDFSKGIRTNVEIVDGKLQLEIVGQKQIYTENLIPVMTSNTTPSGVASASSSYNISTLAAWNAFSKKDSSWISAIGVKGKGWLAYKFPYEAKVSKYTVKYYPSNNNDNIKAWTFEGSNDGTNWTVLDTQIGATGWISNTLKEFVFMNNNHYLNYRLNVTSTSTNDWVCVGELEMMELVTTSTYKSNGTIEFPITDLGSHFREIKSISSIKNIPTGTDVKIYTSTSSDNVTYTDYSLVNSGTGLITSPQGRYIKVKAELSGKSEISTKVVNDFIASESTQFQPDNQIIFDGSLKLKNEYIDEMMVDNAWSDDGKLFIVPLNKPSFKQIDGIEVRK